MLYFNSTNGFGLYVFWTLSFLAKKTRNHPMQKLEISPINYEVVSVGMKFLRALQAFNLAEKGTVHLYH